jgi:hypothetical protein
MKQGSRRVVELVAYCFVAVDGDSQVRRRMTAGCLRSARLQPGSVRKVRVPTPLRRSTYSLAAVVLVAGLGAGEALADNSAAQAPTVPIGQQMTGNMTF